MSVKLEDLNKDLELLTARKEMTLQGYHQLLGGISILEQIMHRLKNPEPKKMDDKLLGAGELQKEEN